MVSPTRPAIGPYRIERELGGCMGPLTEIYLAHDTRVDRAVVLRPLPQETADPVRLQRFERRIGFLTSLSHPNLEAIYGIDEVSGRRFLVLERVEGASLTARIEGGSLSLEQTIATCIQVAAGIEAAHRCGIFHSDLKPGNIFVKPDGHVKVVDFYALRWGHDGDQPVGTLPYLSPEGWRGKPVDARANIWSFGCVLYECLTGRRAFEAETVSEMAKKILTRDVDWSQLPERTPAPVSELLAHCLAKDPMRRLRKMGDARRTLAKLQ